LKTLLCTVYREGSATLTARITTIRPFWKVQRGGGAAVADVVCMLSVLADGVCKLNIRYGSRYLNSTHLNKIMFSVGFCLERSVGRMVLNYATN
jgi:hypothetical protein